MTVYNYPNLEDIGAFCAAAMKVVVRKYNYNRVVPGVGNQIKTRKLLPPGDLLLSLD
jgi:hypothetical protein